MYAYSVPTKQPVDTVYRPLIQLKGETKRKFFGIFNVFTLSAKRKHMIPLIQKAV